MAPGRRIRRERCHQELLSLTVTGRDNQNEARETGNVAKD